MFDTIKLKAENIEICTERLESKKGMQNDTYLKKETGVINDRYRWKEEGIPLIVYYTESKDLYIELSVAKFLYGENVSVVTKEDINLFWTKLENKIKKLFDVEISRYKWKILRVDVCWNFHVGQKVNDYILKLSKIKLPRKETVCYNQQESVYFKNKSSSIVFYDKYKQCSKHKEYKENEKILKRANGILRLEIRPSKDEIKNFNKERKADEILTFRFFEKLTKDVLDIICFDTLIDENFEITNEWVTSNNLTRIESLIGFKMIINQLGEVKAKELYGQNYITRNRWLKEIEFPKNNNLPQLHIDYDEVA